jgi:hypothetical protein
MTDLRVAMNDYLTVRRQLGFQLRETGRLLDDYVTVSERAGEEHLTTELAVRWARSVQAHPNRCQRRLGVIRGFARYLSTIDPETEIPSEDLLRVALPRVAPYLYSQMARCANGKNRGPPGGSAGPKRHAPAHPSAAVRLRQSASTAAEVCGLCRELMVGAACPPTGVVERRVSVATVQRSPCCCHSSEEPQRRRPSARWQRGRPRAPLWWG